MVNIFPTFYSILALKDNDIENGYTLDNDIDKLWTSLIARILELLSIIIRSDTKSLG